MCRKYNLVVYYLVEPNLKGIYNILKLLSFKKSKISNKDSKMYQKLIYDVITPCFMTLVRTIYTDTHKFKG